MKKVLLIGYLLLVSFVTIVLYQYFQVQWVNFRKGEISYKKGRYEEAYSYYIKAVKEGAFDERLFDHLVLTSRALNKSREIVEVYKKVLEKEPDKKIAYQELIEFYDILEEKEKAVVFFEKLLKKYPENLNILLELAPLYLQVQKYDKAIQTYKSVLKEQDSVSIRFFLGRAYEMNRQFEEAKETYQKILQTDSENVLVKLQLADLYLREEKNEKALEILKKIPLDQLSRSSLIHLSKIYFEKKDYKTAKQVLHFYLEESPNDSKALSLLEKISEKMHEKAGDEKDFSIYPKEKEELIRLANTYFWEGNYQKTIEILEIFLKEYPENYDILEELAASYMKINDYNQAIDQFKKMQKIRPEDKLLLNRRIGLLYSWNNHEEKAIQYLKEVFSDSPKDIEVGIELIRNYKKTDQLSKAENVLKKLTLFYPNNPQILAEKIYLMLSYGKMKKAGQIYSQKKNLFNPELKADIAASVYYYDEAEKIYKDLLKKDFSPRILKKLAHLYIEEKRFHEADHAFSQLLRLNYNIDDTLKEYANLKIHRNEYPDALHLVNKIEQPDAGVLLLKAEILLLLKEKEKAFLLLENIDNKQLDKEFFLKSAEIEFKLTGSDQKLRRFVKRYPSNLKGQFLLYHQQKNWVDKLSDLKINDLVSIAGLYQEKNDFDQAVELYQFVLKKDPNHFYAKFGLLFSLIAKKEYEKALVILEDLGKIFPENYFIALTKARLYSWIKEYEKSLAAYEKMLKQNRKNPVLKRETARVYAWQDKVREAEKAYEEILTPSVDDILRERIRCRFKNDRFLIKSIELDFLQPYCLYEYVETFLKKTKDPENLQFLLLQLQGLYSLQKAVYREKTAKEYYVNNQYLHAKKEYERLIALEPWNEEAIFDYAQTFCQFGFCNRSKEIYEELLEFKKHSFSEKALELNELEFHPFIESEYRFFREKGRGELDRITQNRVDLKVGYPINCKQVLSFSGIFWNERPHFPTNTDVQNSAQLAKSYPAYGFSLDWKGALASFLSADAGFFQKYYNGSFSDRCGGYIHFLWNFYDYLYTRIGFDQENKIDNYFSLKNATQYRRFQINGRIPVKRKLDIEGNLRFDSFNDSNQIQYHDFSLAFNLFSNPILIKLKALAEYRDSEKENIFVFENGNLENIVYPYWTPQNYWAYRLSLDWIHDFSKERYCGNQYCFYEFKAAAGSDTEKNPTFTLEGIWHYEFLKRWSLEVSGLLHRSSLWDSEEIKAEIRYRF